MSVKARQDRIRGQLEQEKHMTVALQPGKVQSVPVVEADILDRMNETNALIADRAYEIYQSRGGRYASDQDDWFRAEQEVLPQLVIERYVTDSAVRLTAQLPGFDAKDLEVAIGHQRAVICGVHSAPNQAPDRCRENKRVMRIVELPFDVDPISAKATLQSGTLQVVLTRLR
jgi:HSP20 family molecular chaperone IbpA